MFFKKHNLNPRVIYTSNDVDKLFYATIVRYAFMKLVKVFDACQGLRRHL